jgi:putative Mn2+ efflux pump MntP
MKRLMLLIALLLPLLTWAHPGHGETEGFTIKHYMVEPEHVLFALLALAVVIFFVGRKKEMHDVEEQKH